MIKFNFKNPISIITLISFFAIIIISISFLLREFQKLKIEKEDVIRKQQELQQREIYFSTLKEKRKKLEKYQEQLTIINFALPDDAEANIPSLYRFLQTASAEAGLTLVKIDRFIIMPYAERVGLEKTQVSFQVTGLHTAFKAFLVEMDRSARIIKVENISFSSPKEEGLLTFNLKISVHSYKEQLIFPHQKEININFEILRQPIFENLELFPEIKLEEADKEHFLIPF
jgi:Tfp pilus assembly protein PilO